MVRDKYILIQSAVYTLDATGGSVASYTNFWVGWAKVDEMNYKQAMESGQPTGNQSVKLYIIKNELTELITTAMKLTYRNNEYNISMTREVNAFQLELIATIKRL